MILKLKLVMFPLIAIVAGVLAGCESVEAWERGTLAKPEMAIVSDSLEAALNDHIYFSKEASNGGHSATGGGCGCN
jgi:hypothetical protein